MQAEDKIQPNTSYLSKALRISPDESLQAPPKSNINVQNFPNNYALQLEYIKRSNFSREMFK